MKIQSLYGISNKYIQLVSVIYENNVAEIKVEIKATSWFSVKEGVKQGSVLFVFKWIVLLDLILWNTVKTIVEDRMKWEVKWRL